MGDQSSTDERAAETWTEEADLRRKRRRGLHPGFFSLSGGVMKDKSGAGSTIDYLLAKMLENPETFYVSDIDRNLDCLLTSLQLEMIKPDQLEAAPRQADEKMRKTIE